MTCEEFHHRFTSDFNDQQLQAVQAVEGPVLLLAVPGSGKTTVLVTRLGYLVLCAGIDPARILTMTYTVAATREMRQRFGQLFGGEIARQMEFRTINGVSAKIIEYYSQVKGQRWPFALLENEGEISRLVGQLYQESSGEFASESTIKDLRTAFTFIKNQMLTDEELDEQEFDIPDLPELYRLYRKTLRQMRLMDYDDQMTYALTILTRNPSVLEYFQDRFPYICVDEAQDTSRIQHEIIRLLAQKTQNLFMVGDEDQSIYGFRAAYPKALLEFESVHPGASVLLMERNYRSTPQIIEAANAFVSQNAQRYDKTIRPVRPDGAPVRFVETLDRNAQYAYLFALAQNCTRETAVLYRNNDSCLPLIDLLERNSIPYRCRNFDGAFFSHRIIQDFTAFIRLALDPLDEDAFLRIYYKMDRCISKKAATGACDKSRDSGRPILEMLACSGELPTYVRGEVRELVYTFSQIPKMTADEAVACIWEELRYGHYVETNNLDMGKYSILRLLARNETGPAALLARLEQLRNLIRNHPDDPQAQFILSTIHSSKGLEYDRVYLLDVMDSILPDRNQLDIQEPDELALYQEDRRLFYVAMTRAKNELYIFRIAGLASEFVEELRAQLPLPTVDENDLLAPLFSSRCGKTYTHNLHGTGRIAACEGDLNLIEFADHTIELMTLSQMIEQRAQQLHRKPKAKPKPSPAKTAAETAAVKVGSTVYHTLFGKGTVAELSGDIAAILFEGSDSPRQMSLSVCLSKGLLKLRSV